MLNNVCLQGRLTRDPELRYTQNNTPVCTFGLAIKRNQAPKGGERQTDFIDCVAWRGTAELVSRWFTKGMLIIVVGSIQSRRWQDKNGNNRTAIEVVADEIQFGESKRDREKSSGNASSASQMANSLSVGDDFSEFEDDREIPF